MLALLFLALSAVPAQASACELCDGCPNISTRVRGLTKHVESPMCPEGSVATLESLRSSSSGGSFTVQIKNSGKYSYGGTAEGTKTKCFDLQGVDLPVVGDQQKMEVVFNCKSWSCTITWDAQFGCKATGTLVSQDGGVQVISDVDDTIVCPNPQCNSITNCLGNGDIKHYLAGKDKRLEAEEMYPGVAELMLGLALGPDGSPGAASGFVPAKPMLLSARPREASSFLSITQDSKLNVYMESIGKHIGEPSWGANVDGSRYGTIFDGVSYKEMGQTKAKSFNSISRDSPDTKFVFMGDNGQGDVCGGQSMLESSAGDRMAAVLIQMTQDPSDAIGQCESPEGVDFELHLPEGDKVHYFTTHPDAALWALNKNLISCCSARTLYDAVEEWHSCRCRGARGCNLPTGVNTLTTRNETLRYCDDVAESQGRLLTAVQKCSCAAPAVDQRREGAVALSLAAVEKVVPPDCSRARKFLRPRLC